jgi:hypothetical protein
MFSRREAALAGAAIALLVLPAAGQEPLPEDHCDHAATPTRDTRGMTEITEVGVRLAAGLRASRQVVVVYWGRDPADEAEVNKGACDAYVSGVPVAGLYLADNEILGDRVSSVSVYAGADLIREFPIDGRDLRAATRAAAARAFEVVWPDGVPPDAE